MYSYTAKLYRQNQVSKIDMIKHNILEASELAKQIGIKNNCDYAEVENVDPYRANDCKVIINLK